MDGIRRNRKLSVMLLALLAICVAPFDSVWCYAGDTGSFQVTVAGRCVRCDVSELVCRAVSDGHEVHQELGLDGSCRSCENQCACTQAPAGNDYLAAHSTSLQRAPALGIVSLAVIAGSFRNRSLPQARACARNLDWARPPGSRAHTPLLI